MDFGNHVNAWWSRKWLDTLLESADEQAVKQGLKFVERGQVTSIDIIDNGSPFDPLQQADPDVTSSAEDRKIGGLGIFIVKKTMDSVCYRRNGDQNELAITKML